MSTGHYHRRWSAGSSASRSTPISNSLTSNVEPSTYGTSWNSVRWNKPNTGTGYRSLSTLASQFEPRTPSKSHYSPSPIGRSTKPSSLGPSVSVRASRFDSTIRDQKDKYRTEARDLINKWTSRERGSANTVEPSYSSRKLDTPANSIGTSYPYRTSTIAPRAHSTSVSRYSSYERPANSSYTSPSPTPQTQWSYSTPYIHTLKAERPWRQRMAESQRIRATLGDEVSSRNRESSSIYGPNSRFTSSFASHSGYKPPDETFTSKYMSRSYSPIRSTSDIFRNTSSSRLSHSAVLDRQPSLEADTNREDARDKGVSAIPRNPSIRESSKEKDVEKKRFSSKERTARRNSRQQSLNLETSSSEEDVQVKEETRRQRRKKSKHSLPGTAARVVPNNENVKLDPGDTVAELTNQLVDLANKDEQLASCSSTPKATRKFSKSTALSRVPSKTKIIKSPSVVEVPGISKSESVSSIKSPSFKTAPSEEDRKKILVGSNSLDNIDDLTFDSCEDTQDDESQYSAIAHFKPFKPMVKRLAPVPGLWNMTGGEENISRNKSFEKEQSTASTFLIIKVKPKETTCKKLRTLKAPKKTAKAETNLGERTDNLDIKSKRVLPKKVVKVAQTSLSKLGKDENITISKSLNNFSSSAGDLITLKDSPKRKVSLRKIRSVPTLREVGCHTHLQKKVASSNTSRTLKIPLKTKSVTCSNYKEPKSYYVQMDEEIFQKERSSGAQVIVDTPQNGVNVSKIRKKIKLQPKELLEPAIISDNDRTPEHASVTTEDIRRSSSRAADFLDEMRYTEPCMEWNRDDLESSGILILPDKSILEEYVRRKRGRLERLHSEPIQERDESSDRGSPCPSTKSELLPACTARVANPSSYGHSYITTPTRNHSIEPATTSATPTTSGAVMLLDSIQPATNYNNFNSTPQAFLRANTARIQCARPIQFEAPKSAFEERMQMQANAIRKASINSTTSDDFKQSGEPTRRGSDSMNSISSAFEAALAEKQQGLGRHERYAAHIPVLRGDGSGRQSAASVDSSQSGVLETASKQLDQVIDQARHRHHQHRSKFKEAIDYLDQIFEDLKKECEPTEEVSVKPSKSANASIMTQPVPTASTKKENISVKKPNAIITPTVGQINSNSLKTNSLPTRGNKNKVMKPPSPLDVVITAGMTSSNSLKSSKPSKDTSEPPTEYAVTETIVLPKKTDKLDFTRRWLHNDLSSLAHNGPVNLISDSGTYLDEDEHSLGSCSAEVAAINVDKIKKPTKQPQIILPHNQPAPIRPQPFRPQPGYIGAAGSSNGTRHFPVDIDNRFTSSSSLQRVASFDHMSPEKRSNDNHYWRSGSQEPYHTLQSVRSDAEFRPSPSAFQALGNRGSSLRASLRSLPDASIVRANSVSKREHQQPPLSIDQLVAELELNTETQQTLANDKRRSFPTSLEAEVSSLSRNNSQRDRTAGAGVRTSYHAPVAQVKSNVASRNSTLNHKSLDEVTSLLNNVVGDMNNSNVQLRRKQTNTSTTNGNQLNPFETINQEKINPSRVEAMHNMFERGGSTKTRNVSGNSNANSAWRAGPQPFRRIAQHPPSNNNINNNNNNNNNIKPLFDEESYYDIADFAVKPYRKVSPPRQVLQTTSTRKASPSIDSIAPAYPSSQPPQFPPSNNNIRNGSATSSTNGGYYSSNSSMAGGNQMTRRSSLVGHQSISSRAPSIDDEDDGFYDNIGVYDDRRCSHGSDMDIASISSRPPGNAKGTRIGSFLRKIGGRTNRPPGSAASLISLNKVANETHLHQGILQKSNSMSSEPWNKQILQSSGKGLTSSNVSSSGTKGDRGNNNGIGTRLKNSLFGSKKRLNG